MADDETVPEHHSHHDLVVNLDHFPAIESPYFQTLSVHFFVPKNVSYAQVMLRCHYSILLTWLLCFSIRYQDPVENRTIL